MRKDFTAYLEKLSGLSEYSTLKDFIYSTDYTTAPASTRYHSAYAGGLLDHSTRVTKNLLYLTEKFNFHWDRPESPYLIGLFHDICKVNFYKTSYRNVKNEVTGVWQKAPFYEIQDNDPLGHGSKSVILLQKMIKLTDQEIYCILYHMSAFGDSDYQRDYSKAVVKYPEILMVALADHSAGVGEERGAGCSDAYEFISNSDL